MKAKLILFFIALSAVLFSCKKDKSSGPQYGSVTDIEGNVYKTIKIGGQEWMVENLKTHKLNDGTPIAYVTADATWSDVNIAAPMMCYYDNDDLNNKEKYGALYNWHTVNTGKLAPVGWHVPTDADWQKLQDYLIANGYNFDGSTTGNKIGKSLAMNTGWDADATVGNVGNDQASNNKSNFSALPAGFRSKLGMFGLIGNSTYWWSLNASTCVGVETNSTEMVSGAIEPETGLSVRCVKD